MKDRQQIRISYAYQKNGMRIENNRCLGGDRVREDHGKTVYTHCLLYRTHITLFERYYVPCHTNDIGTVGECNV